MRDQDITLARTAAQHHGVVTVQQLRAANIGRDATRRRVAAGRLHRVHRGVYAVGHPALGLHGRYLAAVLACGESAVLSHRAAAHLLRLIRRRPPEPAVTVPYHRSPSVPGVEVHRTRHLHPLDHSVLDGIPLTTVPRTLVDLAATLESDELGRACHEAQVLHHVTPEAVEVVIARMGRRHGTTPLLRLLRGDDRVTLSPLERAFLTLLRDHGLPLPETNRPAGADRVDCRWPDRRLVVELDSYRFHATRQAWEEDLRRERRARARGDEHRRFTWGDVVDRPAATLAELRTLLG